jgi:hypothetical protein
MPDNQLPDFAALWIQQWKRSAPLLQSIRDEELRRLGEHHSASDKRQASLPIVYDRYPERHGMVIMQRWFMRRHLMDQVARRADQE